AADLIARTQAVASVAATHADAVDRDGRFPVEAFTAARTQRLLGIMVPHALGGEGARISDAANVAYMLGRSCASTALIYAMHQTKVACVIRHGHASAWHQRFLRRLVSEQLLLASSTTEGQRGGDLRNSVAPLEKQGVQLTLEREATVISYGEQADGVVTTARRAADAAASDQSLAVLVKENYSLERVLEWDTLGMRGTCSA